MKNKRSVTIVDVRVLDTVEGAGFVKDLESKMNLIYVIENPELETEETLDALRSTNSAVLSNAGKLNSQDFFRSVFDFVDNGVNEVVSVVGHYYHWEFINSAKKHKVPFSFVSAVDSKKVVLV